MGRPQLGFPRLRFASGRVTGIAIGPDHTPPWVTVRRILARVANGFEKGAIARALLLQCEFLTSDLRVCFLDVLVSLLDRLLGLGLAVGVGAEGPNGLTQAHRF
jgi:hypothetical protein